jgi:hypothetical protein
VRLWVQFSAKKLELRQNRERSWKYKQVKTNRNLA